MGQFISSLSSPAPDQVWGKLDDPVAAGRRRRIARRARRLWLAAGGATMIQNVKSFSSYLKMHDIKWILDNVDAFARGLRRRGMPEPDGKALIDGLLSLDERRRVAIAKLEQAQARRNAASKEIGQAKAKKDEARAQALMAEVAALKDGIPSWRSGPRSSRRSSTASSRSFPTCRPTMSRMASMRPPMSSATASAPSATTRSRPSSTSIWARRSARWILPRLPSCRARASWC